MRVTRQQYIEMVTRLNRNPAREAAPVETPQAAPKRPQKSGYNLKVVMAWFDEVGIPRPIPEFRLCQERLWRYDFGWVEVMIGRTSMPVKVLLEVDGGLWSAGAHNRGARMLKTWERDNEAACRGYRVLRCQPADLCTEATATTIKRALGVAP